MPLTLPNLGLKVWNAPTDPYNSTQLAQNFYRIDEHDHSPGKGRTLSADSLADFAVTSLKLADSSVTTAKIADAAVTSRKFKPTMGHVKANAVLTLSGAGADVPGATVTITPAIAAKLYVFATFHFRLFESGTGNPQPWGQGDLLIDGVSQGQVRQSLLLASAGTTAPDMETSTVGIWSANLTAASHTIKLWANKGGTCNGSVIQQGTGFVYLLTAQ